MINSKCPDCGISWDVVRDMQKEPKGTDNRDLVEVITANCRTCYNELKGEGGKNGNRDGIKASNN